MHNDHGAFLRSQTLQFSALIIGQRPLRFEFFSHPGLQRIQTFKLVDPLDEVPIYGD